jgi:signal transduction histidine kinase
MAPDDVCEARYLEAVARVTPALAHDVRGALGNLTLQLALLAESLRRGVPDDAAAREKLEGVVARAQAGIPMVLAAVERLTGLMHPASSAASLDLGAWVASLEGTLAPRLRERRVTWSASVEDGRTSVRGDPERTRRALFALAVGALDAVPDGGALEASLARAGERAVLTFAWRAPGNLPAPAIADGPWRTLGPWIAAQGGECRIAARPGGAALEVRLPLAARAAR